MLATTYGTGELIRSALDSGAGEVLVGVGGPATVDAYPNAVPTTVDGVLDRLRSTSFVAALADGPRDELLASAAGLLATHAELTGPFEYPHDTVLYRCRLQA